MKIEKESLFERIMTLIEPDSQKGSEEREHVAEQIGELAMPILSVFGTVVGIIIGFFYAGVGGAIVGSVGGLAAGYLFSTLILPIILIFFFWATGVVLILGAVGIIVSVISLLWDVGKP